MDKCFPKNNQLHSVEEALNILLSHVKSRPNVIEVAIENSLGCIIAADIVSNIDIPPADNSSMDGFALNINDWVGEPLPLGSRICAGDITLPLKPNTIAQIFTGAQIPIGANCVVIQEECEVVDNRVEIFSLPSKGDHIRKQGEDLKKNQVILKKGHQIRPQEIGLLASIGQTQVSVYRPLKVAIFSTGNEIVNPGQSLKTGQIYNSNRWTLLGLLADIAVEVIDLGIVPDTLESTQSNLLNASNEVDIILTTGGVSEGEEDYMQTALNNLGEVMMYKVAMKPGKPFTFAKIKQTFFMGLPGNPVSTFAVFNLFVRPFLMRLLGQINYQQQQYKLTANFNWQSGNRCEYLRAKQQGYYVDIYPNQSSGVLRSTTWADGFCVVDIGQAIKKGDKIPFIPFSQWGRL